MKMVPDAAAVVAVENGRNWPFLKAVVFIFDSWNMPPTSCYHCCHQSDERKTLSVSPKT